MGSCETVNTTTRILIAGITALLAVLPAAPPRGWAEEPAAPSRVLETAAIAPGEKLTVGRCVEIALQNSPNILVASHTVDATRNRVGQASSAYYPQISLTGSYTKGNTFLAWPSNTVSPLQDTYGWSAMLTQNIVDFGRTEAQVSMRRKDLIATREDFRDATGQIVFNVKRSYYSFLWAAKSRDVLKETVALFEKKLYLAREFYEAGERSRFDVTTADVELTNARLELVRAENVLRMARVTLDNAMGVPDAPEYEIEDTLVFRKYPVTFEEARDRAFLNRPDIRSTVARREAAEDALSIARKGNFPTLSGSANFSRTSADYPPERDIWNVGLTLTIPFFSGFLTTHQVGEAKENLNVNKAKEETIRQNVILTVQQAYIKLMEAEERLGLAELTVKQAQENYDLALGRYEEGVGIALEETNALVSLSKARLNVITALADYKIAEAELQRAMGE